MKPLLYQEFLASFKDVYVTNIKITFLVILMCCAQNLKSQNILSPEKVFDLYFNSFVRYNDDDVKEVNSYLINFLGKESTVKMNLQNAYEQNIDHRTQLFLSGLSPDTASECKIEAREYFRILMSNFRNAKYSIKSIQSVNSTGMEKQQITEVAYQISFKVPEHISVLNMGDIKNIKGDEIRKYLMDMADHAKNADKTITSEQKFNLYQVKSDTDIYYWNGGPQELLWKAEDFYFKNIN